MNVKELKDWEKKVDKAKQYNSELLPGFKQSLENKNSNHK